MTGDIVSSDDVIGVNVENREGENLGEIEALMLNKYHGNVEYVVLSFGGFLNIGNKLFAMPWKMFNYDPDKECFVIPVDKEKLKNSPGFDRNNWPDMSDEHWARSINDYYGTSNTSINR